MGGQPCEIYKKDIGVNILENNAVVSIIMPVYKSEEYIRDSILSVENQTYPYIELICINDKTPDSSFEVCKKMSKQYTNIKLLENEENMGQAFSRNQGIKNAKGKYIMFLDSDDTIVPDTVENLVDIAETNLCEIVIFSFSRIINGDEYKVIFGDIKDGLYKMKDFSKFFLRDFDISAISNIGTKLYRSDFLRNNGIEFNIDFKYNEDAGFALDAFLRANQVYYINEQYYKYFIRSSGSTMSSYRPKMFLSVSSARELMKQLFIKHDIWNNEERMADYYQEMLGLMLNSLINEIKFGNKQSFREACEIIRNYKDFDEMCDCLKKANRLSRTRKLILPFLQKKHWNIVYALVKVQQIKK